MIKNPVKFSALPVNNKVLKNYQTISKTFFLYQNVFQVEYLVGFEESEDGYRMMKKPLFNLVTNKILDGSTQPSVLCRTRLYEGGKKRMASIPVPEKLKIVPSDQVFILRKKKNPAGAVKYPLPLVNAAMSFPALSFYVPGSYVITEVVPTSEETTTPEGAQLTPPSDFTGGGYG
jgi:hypothetical protein